MENGQRTVERAAAGSQRGEVPPGYKHTEVGVIPEDWEVGPLGDSCDIITKGTTPTSVARAFTKDGVRFLKAESISESGRTVPDKVAYIDEATHSLLRRSQLRSNDVLISIAGVLGRVGLVDNSDLPANTNQALAIVRLSRDSGIERSFLFCTLRGQCVSRQISDITVQAAQANISLQNVREFLLPLPPLPEQRAIAAALSDVDALLEGLTRLIAKKRDLKQAAMQQLLTGRQRLPGFSGAWETKRLGEIAPLQRGFDLPTSELRAGPFPVVYSNGVLNFHVSFQADGPGVVTGRSGTIGKVTFVEGPYWPHNTALWVTSFKNNDPRFVFYLYKRIGFARFATGSGVPTLNRNDVHSFGAAIPPSLPEQTAIAAVLSDMDAEIAALEARREKTRQIKRGMMQELLTGRTRLVRSAAPAAMEEVAAAPASKHSWAFNEAVVIAMLAKRFGSEEYPLGRKRYTKLAYLLHRHVEKQPEGYLKKPAGPYNHETKYGGPERLALEKHYVREAKAGKYAGFVDGEEIDRATSYFTKWYGEASLQWLEQFHYETNDALELLTTVDMAVREIRAGGRETSVAEVKRVLRESDEWRPKLERAEFSDLGIAAAIRRCGELFGET